MTHHWLLELVWLDAADKERVAGSQSGHEQLQRLLELGGKGGLSLPATIIKLKMFFGKSLFSLLPCLRSHVEVVCEYSLQEPVLADVDKLEEIGAEGVAVLVKEAPEKVNN